MSGFPSLDPALAMSSPGFRPEYFEDLVELEGGSFWFRARRQLALWALQRHCPWLGSMLEIGCGTGWMLDGVRGAFPHALLVGSEVLAYGLVHAARRVPRAEFLQLDARRLPFCEEFDVIGAFDVVEHIREDDVVLRRAFTALKAGGAIILTVPQHMWLWSAADETAGHVRRYRRGELERKLRVVGFEIVRSTSFVSLLLPLLALSRLSKRREGDSVARDLRLPQWLDRALGVVMAVELGMIGIGIDLPAGGSRMVIARKPPDVDASGSRVS